MIGTKVGLVESDMVDPERAVRTIFEASLERLRIERVDLLFLHSQVRLTPDERSISLAGAHVATRLFDQIKMEGRAALSGFTAHGDAAAVKSLARAGNYDALQAYFSAANPSAGYAGLSGGQQDFEGVIDEAAEAGRGVFNIQPLSAGGLLAQAHPFARDFMHGRLLGKGNQLDVLAAELDLDSVYELALRFALAKPGISCVLVGFSSIEQAVTWAGRGTLPTDGVQRVLDLATVEDSATMPRSGSTC